MKEPFDATFRPLTKAQREPAPLPAQVAREVAEGDHVQKELAKTAHQRRKPGPVKRDEYRRGASLAANSYEQLTAMIDATNKAVGAKGRGNKRTGRTGLYGDLVKHFILLRQSGVTLQRGGSLSLAACEHGLASILREHGHLKPDQTDRVLVNSKTRNELGHRLARIFNRVAKAVESIPA